jgi:hypothetical protein
MPGCRPWGEMSPRNTVYRGITAAKWKVNEPCRRLFCDKASCLTRKGGDPQEEFSLRYSGENQLVKSW